MQWIYGKQDFHTIERGQENCYLLTNGLGGFSSLTMTGSAARNDHALLMACVQAPNHRYNMVHRLREVLQADGQEYTLSTQEFADGRTENGYVFLSAFQFDDGPLYRFHVCGVEIEKEIGMRHGENTVAVRYRIRNDRQETVTLCVTPFFQFTKKGSQPSFDQSFVLEKETVRANGLTLFFHTNGTVEKTGEEKEHYYYSYDACDGRNATGCAVANHRIVIQAEAGSETTLRLVYTMEAPEQKQSGAEAMQIRQAAREADTVIEEMKQRRKALKEQAGLTMPLAEELVKSAGQFISRRESTKGSTILAGYPFFEDWGRDTMIALPGICISTRRYQEAKDILRTFAVSEKDGLMPNLFPEGGNAPLYNTVDAALLFINCVYLYTQAVKDPEFVREMYPVMERIIESYRKGTHYGIKMDTDGLLCSGEGLWQVTWMDVRVGDVLPTPRHGKAVEVNAYWYNALCIMDVLGKMISKAPGYEALAGQVKEAFVAKFWQEEKRCLKDLLSGTEADTQIRCNQIWAVSMPFTMLPPQMERAVVETVFAKLYTPYGLRTLSADDPEFHPYYGGPMEERDMAYHQGTVWTFPLGAYYLAYLKVHNYSAKAKETLRRQLTVLESAMREGCIGQLPEIYDGENPSRSKGCFAQAWSVGELLRVYEALERDAGIKEEARGV